MIVVHNSFGVKLKDRENLTVLSVEKLALIEGRENIGDITIIFDSSTKSSQQDSNVIYRMINRFIGKIDNIALIVTDKYDNNAKMLELLLVRNNKYNIFVVDDATDIDEEYIESIMDMTPSIDELKEFIGNDIAVYSRAMNILETVVAAANKSDSTIAEMIREHREDISSITKTMKLLQTGLDEAKEASAYSQGSSSVVSNAENERNLKEIRRLCSVVEDSERENGRLNGIIEAINKENTELREFKESQQKMRAENIKADKYITLNVDRYINSIEMGKKKPEVKSVIYIKEVTPCRYINTLITMLQKYITSRGFRNTKVVIFDKKGFSNFKYGKLKIVDAGSYEKEKQADRLGNIFVASEVARNIIESLLTDCQFVIIYDRMNKDDDIVVGRTVNKYYVVNGEKEEIELERRVNVDKSRVITNFGVDKGMISVREIFDFKIMSPSGRLAAYVNMPSTIDVTKSILDIILDESGVSKYFS